MIFVYLLDPILQLFGDLIIYSSEFVVTGLLDSLYQQSALGVARDPSLSIYAIFVGVVVGLTSGIFAAGVKKDKKIKESSMQKLKVPIIIIAITLPILLFYQFWVLMFQYEVVTSFNQHIRIITPFIEQNEVNIILSDFARMESEADYQSIYGKMHKLADMHNLKLPSNPTYGFWSM